MPSRAVLSLAVASLVLAGCTDQASRPTSSATTPSASSSPSSSPSTGTLPGGGGHHRPGHRPVTLAFAGDVHFQLQLAELLERPRGALGPVASVLRSADLTMLNLESAITEGGTLEAKELEDPTRRYWYRTTPAALDVLAAAGVDVVTVANNHGADYGPVGLQDTLAAVRRSPVAVVGVGRDRESAFRPHRVTVRGTRFAFLAADASVREGASSVWAAGPSSPGLAAAHAARPRALLTAVAAADRRDDVVVVYLHWGAEHLGCPTPQQRTTAQALADAGADVVVGSHAHVLLGSGWLGSTYVDYGLGNFVWYHDGEPDSGVLRLTVRDGQVVRESLVPARIHGSGPAVPLGGAERVEAVAAWRRLRSCTGLAGRPDASPAPAYDWSVQRIGPDLRRRMHPSHHPGCPVPLSDLRYLRVSYVGFDGRSHRGELVVHERYARPVVGVFRRLYAVRWPVRRMRLVDDYGGDDQRSMAANNSSGFNCRRVAGTDRWSAHAYGAAIDLNPLQNPDLTGAAAAPVAGRRFAMVDRSGDADPAPGVVSARGTVVAAFADIGWEWGGRGLSWPDFQHFAAAAEGADNSVS